MIYQQITPQSRFTQIGFTTGRDWLYYPLSIFTCGTCEQEMLFYMNDFFRHYRLDFTNLSRKDNEAIQAHKALQQDTNWDSFLDFYCPQCTVPVRVYYFIEEMTGSQNRAYGIRMEFIIEGIRERGEVE